MLLVSDSCASDTPPKEGAPMHREQRGEGAVQLSFSHEAHKKEEQEACGSLHSPADSVSEVAESIAILSQAGLSGSVSPVSVISEVISEAGSAVQAVSPVNAFGECSSLTVLSLCVPVHAYSAACHTKQFLVLNSQVDCPRDPMSLCCKSATTQHWRSCRRPCDRVVNDMLASLLVDSLHRYMLVCIQCILLAQIGKASPSCLYAQQPAITSALCVHKYKFTRTCTDVCQRLKPRYRVHNCLRFAKARSCMAHYYHAHA